jgi:hypothetical protein
MATPLPSAGGTRLTRLSTVWCGRARALQLVMQHIRQQPPDMVAFAAALDAHFPAQDVADGGLEYGALALSAQAREGCGPSVGAVEER